MRSEIQWNTSCENKRGSFMCCGTQERFMPGKALESTYTLTWEFQNSLLYPGYDSPVESLINHPFQISN